MKNSLSVGLFSLILLLSGCAGFQAAREVDSGRQAYLIGNNEAAYAHFQKAAQADPQYVYGTALRQGVWSYVGRVDYDMGRLPQARQALERALAANRQEDLTRLYFGLALAREGDRERGLKEIEGGLRGMHEWLVRVCGSEPWLVLWKILGSGARDTFCDSDGSSFNLRQRHRLAKAHRVQ